MANPNLTIGSNPPLFISEIQDIYLRKNFEQLYNYFNAQNQLFNFKFKELVFDAATANFSFPHGLGIIPQDIVVTRITGAGKVTFLYGNFDQNNIYLSVDAPCRIRFFYGTYWNFVSDVNNNSSDHMVIDPGV